MREASLTPGELEVHARVTPRAPGPARRLRNAWLVKS